MPTPPQPGSRQWGRALPATIDQFTNPRLNEASKELILELLQLVKARHHTLTAMIRNAMQAANRPSWAVGEVTNPQHVASAKSALSKSLGRAAIRPPDWSLVEWIVTTCVEPDQADRVLAEMAARWCKATGSTRPPGYTGAFHVDEEERPKLVDPAQAGDDITRARLLQDRVAQLQTQVEARDNEVAEHDKTISELTVRVHRLQADLYVTTRELKAAREGIDIRLRASHAEKQVLQRQAADTAHYLAMAIAHLATHRQPPHPDELFTRPAVTADPLFVSLLTPVADHGRYPLARWLGSYLNALLRAGDPRHNGAIPYSRYLPVAPKHLDDVLAGRVLPTPDLADRIAEDFPLARRILDAILDEATAIADMPTQPMPPVSRTPSRVKTVPQRDFVTVDELYARERPGIPHIKPDSNRSRRRRQTE